MPGLIFWDVDTQYDFMRADGKLYVPGAEEIIPNLERLSECAHRIGIRVVASADDHTAGDLELSETPDYVETFPHHCMRSTAGQEKIPQTALHDPLVFPPTETSAGLLASRVRGHRGDILFTKNRFDVFSNPNVEPVLAVLDPDEIAVYGVALDVCNRFAIEGLLDRRPQTRLYVVTDATKPIVADTAEPLLEAWSRRGAQLVTTADVLQFAAGRSGLEVPHRV